MAQDKSSRPNLVEFRRALSGEARARADAPAPEITLGFSEEEAPTASLPKPLLTALLRGTLPRAQESPLEPVPTSVAVAAPAYVAPPASVSEAAHAPPAPVSEAAHAPPAARAAPAELAAGATIIVAVPDASVPAPAEETERIQRRQGRTRSRQRRRVSVGLVIAASLFAAAVAGALLWRSEFANRLRGLRAPAPAAAFDVVMARDPTGGYGATA
jgi:hypothetical protein